MVLFTLSVAEQCRAQVIVEGTIKNGDTKEVMIGASVLLKGNIEGSITDIRGRFAVRVKELPITLVCSYIGYQTKEVTVTKPNQLPLEITLDSEELLEGQIEVGSRFATRSIARSPVPVDILTYEELIETGQTTLAQALVYSLPAFNSTQQSVSDATAHFDPTDIRGLGPSRTLVLINGKRKNASTLVYINDTAGKGEVGVDWRSIPLAAVQRIEVLRDGASAQYGSDAIAGVINIILKDGKDGSNMRGFSGISQQGDGFEMGYALNAGLRLGDRGSLVMSASFHEQRETNRAGEPGKDDLFGVGADNPWIQQNPDLGMNIGQPYVGSANIMFNGSVDVDDKHEIYGFGGVAYRKGISYALYRTPYWVQDPFNILHNNNEPYEGFLPTFEVDVSDNTLVLGTKGVQGAWRYDISIDWGNSSTSYLVNNSLNPTLGQQSPTRFEVGQYDFGHVVSNMDIGRSWGEVALTLGTELRRENFLVHAGEESSYTGAGVQSFPGLQPFNEVDVVRYNVGAYVEANWEVNTKLLLDAAVRFERYSDFGNSFTWKFNARYSLAEWINLRGSVSTGFRAPTLHQSYFSSIQSLVSGGSISNQGTFNNLSPVVRALGVPLLKEENSFNISTGVALNLKEGLSFTADYYRISLDDRVVFTGNISSADTTTAVGRVLQDYQVTSLKFFANAASTVSSGVGLALTYNDLELGKGKLNVRLSANITKHRLNGTINAPDAIEDAGVEIFGRKEQSRILTGRPNHKINFRLNYILDRWNITLLNTRFGEVTWKHEADDSRDQVFGAKIITDLRLNYRLSKIFSIGVVCNNLLNVYPDELDPKGDIVTDLGGRFKYGWDMQQFGVRGRFVLFEFNMIF